MAFEEILDQAVAMPQRRGGMIYRTLQRQFGLDEDTLTKIVDLYVSIKNSDRRVGAVGV